MAHCQLSVDIDAPVEAVWLLAQDPKRRPEWDYLIQEAELVDSGIPETGARLRSKGNWFGSFEVEIEFIAVEPERRSLAMVESSRGLPFTLSGGSWRFIKRGENKCRFEALLFMKTRASWVGNQIDRLLMQPLLRRMTRKSLEQLKAVAERDFKQKGMNTQGKP